MTQRPTGRRWASRGASALLAGVLALPLAMSGAHAQSEPPPAAPADDPALDWNNYERVLLSKETGEPIGMAVLPDSRVIHTARNGEIRLTNPETGLTELIADIDVYANSEDGLQGIALDPNFEENGWVYTVYAPRVMDGLNSKGDPYPETTPAGSAPEQLPAGEDIGYWDQWLGYNVLSRFQLDAETGTFDVDSEQEIIRFEVERGQCCHVGADIAFDGEGNLFLSTGDNTPAGTPGANAYTPINNREGFNPGFDARRGAGNTNDLRGAILRITPNEEIAADADAEPGEGSTYTIPEGNLFSGEEYADEPVREEIYVFGLRNPFRIAYDIESEALFWGEYGPDAPQAQDDRGPMGYVEWQLTTEPMNGGWPYCHGPNDEPYSEWDFETGAPTETGFFDCDAGPVNNSTWNTGMVQMPPVTEPQIWYGDNPGDQPWDEFVTFADRGGQAPMGGPMYRYDPASSSPTKFPEYWDGKIFMGEFSQDYMAVLEMDEPTSAGEVTGVTNFLPNAHLYEQAVPEWRGIIDMEFGPDGSLYVLEYGKGFFRQNPDAGLYRIDYNEGNQAPRASFTADPVSGSDAPLTVNFDASASFDPEGEDLTYEWDLYGNGEIDATGETLTYTYEERGQYTVVLRVSDPQGLFGLAVGQITVGNTAPEVSLTIDDGAIFDWGDTFTAEVRVSDAEDGDDPDCERVSWIFGLGHDDHAHPELSGTGCTITVETRESAREHGEGEKLFGTLVVSYTDEPQGEVPATTGETTLVLKPQVQQAQWFDAIDGATVVSDSGAGAGAYVTDLDSGSITFAPMAFSHAPTGDVIDTVTARGQGEGTLSLSWGEAETPFAEFPFTDEDGWQDVETTLTEIPEGSGSVVVTATGDVDLDSLEFLASGEAPGEPGEPGENIVVPAEQVSIGMFSLTNWVDEVGLPAVLARLAEIGFENIEPFGSNFSGYTAAEFRTMVDELGLSVPSSHYNTAEATFDETLEFVETLGQEYVGSGGFVQGMNLDTYESTVAVAEAMDRLGQRSVEAGVGKFFGHNHASEFTTVHDIPGDHGNEGQMSAWEILVENTNPEYVTFQLDVAWAAHAGVDVPALIEEHGDRIELLHVKDATNLGGSSNPTFVNLGEGDVDLQGILAAAEEHADIAYYVMELDRAADGETFVETGFEYLTGREPGEVPAPVEVTPAAVTFTDLPGTENDTFTVPRVVGVEYLVDGDVVAPGTYPGAGTVTVTARPAEGYVLAEGSTAQWSHTFSTEVAARTAEFHLSNTWAGTTDVRFPYGRTTDEVFIGDWDGDGRDTVALRRGNTFHVSNSLRGGDADRVFPYGRPGDDVLVGDWNGDGRDTFAVRRGAEYHVKNSHSGGEADTVIRYGREADQVLVGDWNGDSRDTFAVRRGATYYVKNSMSGGPADVVFAYGRAADITLAGDWNGDGRDTFAVQRGRTFYVNHALRGGAADQVVTFGRLGDEVFVGDWNGNGTDTLGIRRPAQVVPSSAAAATGEVRALSKVG
ncbi:PQQ-dependent sugar dehydrogenase [Georgenia satyanarayanai]|uniref:PQQ-dependent sugar dehydrogenase n=1 Tax=Georgenia satyanarayanai TaxID=860221 RepID=UPI0012640174|nr:PQQ-dependent sugar dehydrogenase [Georgenia satyanarayanai]